MGSCERRVRFFVLLGFCSTICTATILVKFGRVAFHYQSLMKDKDSIPPDPLENFGPESRQFLCDAALNAKQFMSKYTPGHYQRVQQSITSITDLNVLIDGSKVNVSKNYQRIHDDTRYPNPEYLQYQLRSTRMGSNSRKQIKSLQCVNEMTVKWFVTFGLVDKFLFLLEPGSNRRFSPLRITGIFDPMPIVDDRPPEYLYQQFRSSKGALESLCNLAADDQLRLCSALLVLLSPRGTLVDANYLAKERHSCIKNDVKLEGRLFGARFLRCTIFQGETPVTLFHVLADSTVREAVFVFKEGRAGKALELYRYSRHKSWKPCKSGGPCGKKSEGKGCHDGDYAKTGFCRHSTSRRMGSEETPILKGLQIQPNGQ